MASSVLIRLLPEGAAEWLALGNDGRVLAGPQAGLPATRAERVEVIVPADDVLLLRAPRVARQRRQLEQALPFAVEEQLAAPVETLHVAAAQEHGDDIVVAVVAQARMDAWLAQLREAGLEPDRMIPEQWLLPCADGHAAALVQGERAMLRYAEAGAFSGRRDELSAWLALLAADARAVERLRWIGDAVDIAPIGVAIEHEAAPATLRWFAARLAHGGGLDLLQGRYATRRGREGARAVWRWAAVLAAIALFAGIAHLAIERRQLEARRDAQRAEMEQLLRTAMPALTRIVDPKAQLSAEYARVGQAATGGGALPLLARIAPVIAGSGRYTIDGLEYRADTLELVVRSPDVAALDSLRETLSNLPQLQVELTSANPGSGGVEGRLRIRSRA